VNAWVSGPMLPLTAIGTETAHAAMLTCGLIRFLRTSSFGTPMRRPPG